ncbi:protealysin inhibitor emfourin [Phormidesmis priestleyi]
MKIFFERSGGFAGLIMTTSIDTETLSSTEANQVCQMVEAADFFNLPATIASPSQPDRFHYQITVEEGDRQHTIQFGESAMPDRLPPLVDWLLERCKQD